MRWQYINSSKQDKKEQKHIDNIHTVKYLYSRIYPTLLNGTGYFFLFIFITMRRKSKQQILLDNRETLMHTEIETAHSLILSPNLRLMYFI